MAHITFTYNGTSSVKDHQRHWEQGKGAGAAAPLLSVDWMHKTSQNFAQKKHNFCITLKHILGKENNLLLKLYTPYLSAPIPNFWIRH